METVNKNGKTAKVLYYILFIASLGFIAVMLPDLQSISDMYATTTYGARYNPYFTSYFSLLTAFFGTGISAVILGGVSAVIKADRRKTDALKTIAWFCASGSVSLLNLAFLVNFAGYKSNGEAVGYVFSLPIIASCFVTAVLSAIFINKQRKHVARSAAANAIIAILSVVFLVIFRSVDEDSFRYQSGTNYCFIAIVPALLLSCGETLRHMDSFKPPEGSADARLRCKAAVAGIYVFVLLLAAQTVAFDLNLYSSFTMADADVGGSYFILFGFVSITNMFWALVYIIPTVILLIVANLIASGASKGKYNCLTKLKAVAIVTLVFGAISIVTMLFNDIQLGMLNKGWSAAWDPESKVDRALIMAARYYNRFAYYDSLIGMRNTAFMTLIPLARIAAAIAALVLHGKAKNSDAAQIPNGQDGINGQTNETTDNNDIF